MPVPSEEQTFHERLGDGKGDNKDPGFTTGTVPASLCPTCSTPTTSSGTMGVDDLADFIPEKKKGDE